MKVEHPIGFEPITRCLQGSRSTIELREQIAGIRGPAPHQEECQWKFVLFERLAEIFTLLERKPFMQTSFFLLLSLKLLNRFR